jgi:chromosome segregation ATPase
MSTNQVIAAYAADASTDYGKAVAAAREAVAASESPAERTARLESELTAAQAALDTAMAPLRRGESSEADFGRLAQRISDLQKDLTTAREAAAEADTAERREQRAECEAVFERGIPAGLAKIADIRQLYASLARALGEYAGIVQRTIAARNALSVGFPDPARDRQLADVTNRASLEPLHDLLDSGLEPLYDYGHDLRITVPALREKE